MITKSFAGVYLVDDETKIHELIDQWEEAREQGRPISLEDLCRDRPDLLPRVKEYIDALEQPFPWEAAQEDGCQSASDAKEDSQQQANRQHSDGDKFGDYKLEEFLRDGGSRGEVWRTFDHNLQRAVAIKIVPREERSLEEARKAAQLRHAGIVPVHYADHQDNWTYFVSDLIDGPSLAEVICQKRERLPRHEVVRIVSEVADALDYAHSKKIIHRDVKPGNILLDRKGTAYLADFGIAITVGQPLDERDAVRGTLSYMSPEQVRGKRNLIDNRTDIYSLGVVMFEMLTGKLPYPHGVLPVQTYLDQIASDELVRDIPPHELLRVLYGEPRPRTFDASIPLELDQICFLCLEYEPKSRYKSVRDLASSLQKIHCPDPTLPQTPLGKFLQERPRRDHFYLRKKDAEAVTCAQCKGSGRITVWCNRCYAAGKVICPECYGNSPKSQRWLLTLGSFRFRVCAQCRNTGAIPCTACSGTGGVLRQCPACEGRHSSAGLDG